MLDSITLNWGAAAASHCQEAMAEGISVRLRDVTAGEEHSALSRACWALAGYSSPAASAAATDRHLHED